MGACGLKYLNALSKKLHASIACLHRLFGTLVVKGKYSQKKFRFFEWVQPKEENHKGKYIAGLNCLSSEINSNEAVQRFPQCHIHLSIHCKQHDRLKMNYKFIKPNKMCWLWMNYTVFIIPNDLFARSEVFLKPAHTLITAKYPFATYYVSPVFHQCSLADFQGKATWVSRLYQTR